MLKISRTLCGTFPHVGHSRVHSPLWHIAAQPQQPLWLAASSTLSLPLNQWPTRRNWSWQFIGHGIKRTWPEWEQKIGKVNSHPVEVVVTAEGAVYYMYKKEMACSLYMPVNKGPSVVRWHCCSGCQNVSRGAREKRETYLLGIVKQRVNVTDGFSSCA